jgi:hypothetical protein
VKLYLHNTDEVSGVGRRCHKAVFSLLPLAYRAVFLLAGALALYTLVSKKLTWHSVGAALVWSKKQARQSLQGRILTITFQFQLNLSAARGRGLSLALYYKWYSIVSSTI